MISNISCKLSAFSDYGGLAYSNNNAILLLKNFEEYMPRMIKQFTPDIIESRRLQLVSKDGHNFITILKERIDVEIVSDRKEGFSENEKIESVQTLLDILKRVYKCYKDIPDSDRMAWFVSYVYFDIGAEEKTKFRRRFLKEPTFYKNELTDEFNVRFVSKKEFKLKKTSRYNDYMNVVTSINRYLANINGDVMVDGYKIDFDINTGIENKIRRFNVNNFELFLNAARRFQAAVEKDFIHV